MKTVVNENSQIYYKERYWNDFPQTQEYLNELSTGDKNLYCFDDFKNRFAKKSFKHGLFLNCGNGWVEREFIQKRIVKKATAFDYSKDLLKEAMQKKGKLPIKYFQADVNKVKLPKDKFDLIVNSAALHHVQFINRLSRILARSLKEEGVFFNYDYIGPHRNQYPLKMWRLVKKINSTLPKKYRQEPLLYPHLPTMLVTDPTEAIHSELILKSIKRYFNILERHDTGGGIAYSILTQNPKIPFPKHSIIKKVLEIDKDYTKRGSVPTLFSYFIATPNKNNLKDKKAVKFHQQLENTREELSQIIENTYSTRYYFKLIVRSRTPKKLIKRVFKLSNYLAKKSFKYPSLYLSQVFKFLP